MWALLKCQHLNFRGRWVPGMTTGVSEGRCQVAGSIWGLPPDVSWQLRPTGPRTPRVQLVSRRHRCRGTSRALSPPGIPWVGLSCLSCLDTGVWTS